MGRRRAVQRTRQHEMRVKKQLLFLRRTPAYGGSEAVILGLLRGIDYERNSVCLASSTDVFSNPLSQLHLPVRCIALSARLVGGAFKMFISSFEFLVRTRPDKVFLAEGSFSDFSLSEVVA